MLHRSEVVALINTLHRFSESLEAVNDFRIMWAETNAKDSAKLVQEAEALVSAYARVRLSSEKVVPLYANITHSRDPHLPLAISHNQKAFWQRFELAYKFGRRYARMAQ